MKFVYLSVSSPRKDGKGYEILLYQRIKFLLLNGAWIHLFITTIGDVYLDDLIALKNLSGKFHFKIFQLGKVELTKNTFRTIFQSKFTSF